MRGFAPRVHTMTRGRGRGRGFVRLCAGLFALLLSGAGVDAQNATGVNGTTPTGTNGTAVGNQTLGGNATTNATALQSPAAPPPPPAPPLSPSPPPSDAPAPLSPSVGGGGGNLTGGNGTNGTGLNGTAAAGPPKPKRKIFAGWGSDEAAVVIGGGCFVWWLAVGYYFIDKEYERYLKHAKKIRRRKMVTMKDRVYWVLGGIYNFFFRLYLQVNVLNATWRIRVDNAYWKLDQMRVDFSAAVSGARRWIKANLLSKAGSKRLFKKAVEETFAARINKFRVSFVLRFDKLPREVAESEAFKTDLATQIASAAAYQVPLDMLDAKGQPVVLRNDAVTLEIEKQGWKMTTQNCNYHTWGYVQKQVKSKGLAVRNAYARQASARSELGVIGEDGTMGEEEAGPKRKFKRSLTNSALGFIYGKSVGRLIQEREANKALGDQADKKKRLAFSQMSRTLAVVTGAGLEARKLKAEEDAKAQEEEEKRKLGRIAVGVKVFFPDPDSAYFFDKWLRGEDDQLPPEKIFEMVYTTTPITDHGPIDIDFGEKLRSRQDIDDDDVFDKEHDAEIVQHIQTMRKNTSLKAQKNRGLFSGGFTGFWRWVFGRWSCCGKRRTIVRRVTRRHLAAASEKAFKTERDRRMLAHFAAPFRRNLERKRFEKSRLRRARDVLYNTVYPEFNCVFEESFYNSFLRIRVEPGGKAHGTYGKDGMCKLEGNVGMAEEPGGKCPQFCGTFEEGAFKGDVRLSMSENGMMFEGWWFDQDGKPGGRWHGTRRRTMAERFLRLLLFHWFRPRRVAPASWVEEVAAARMQSAFRGYLSRVDIGLVSKELKAEAMESMAGSGEFLPESFEKAQRTLTTAALVGQLRSMNNSAGMRSSSGANFGALFAAKRAQLKGESEVEARLEDIMTESEMLAAKALAEDHLAVLAGDTMRNNAAVAAGAAAGGFLGIFGLGPKKAREPPPPQALDMVIVPGEGGDLKAFGSSAASSDDRGRIPRSSVAGGRASHVSAGLGASRTPSSANLFEKGGAAAQRAARKARSSSTSSKSLIVFDASLDPKGAMARDSGASAGKPSVVADDAGAGGGAGAFGGLALVLTKGKLGSSSAEDIGVIAEEEHHEDDSMGDDMWVWLAYLRLKHYLNIFMIVYEVINLWSFVFADSVPWPSRFARTVFRLATGDFRGEVFPVFFFLQWSVYACIFAFWLLDILLVPPKLEAEYAAELKEVLQSADSLADLYATVSWKTIPAVLFEVFTGVKRLLMEGFYMPTMVSCFNMLSCRYPGTGPAYLAVYPEKLCWTDGHIVESIMAGTLLFAIYVATMYISCSVKPYHASLYRWDPIFEGQFLMSKALSCGLATLGVNVFRGRLQIYVLTANLAQLWYTQWTQQPCRGRASAVNNLRTASFAMQFVGAVCGVALVEGPGHWLLYRESIGFFYCLAALPVFLTSWYVNNDRTEGNEIPAVDLVELLKMEPDERGLLKLRKSAAQKARASQVAPAAAAAEGKDVEALVRTDHLACSPGRMGIRVKLVAAVSLTYLMMEDQNLKVVKDGVRHVLRMCAEDAEFHKVARTLLSKYFGKHAPREYKHNVLLKGSRLTLPEAQIVVGHLKSALGLESIVIRVEYPLARIRRNALKSFDLQATAVTGRVTLADALIFKELIRPVAKLTTLRHLSVSGAMTLPVGDLLDGEINEFSAGGAPLTSGDLLILSEYIRINHSLQSLDLSNTDIGPEGIEALSSALRLQRTIETLDLSGMSVCLAANGGTSDANEALKSFILLGNALNENTSLQTLKTHKLHVPVAMLRARRNAPRIKLVDFSNSSRGVLPRAPHESLYDTDVAVIARLLKGAPVDALDLSGNRITGNGCNHLCKVLADPVGGSAAMNLVQLRDLDLSSNNIGSDGCKELGKALRRNGNLRRLNLADNNINVHGAWHIAGMLSATRPGEKAARDKRGRTSYLCALETLILSDNPLGAHGVRSIARHLGDGGEHEAGKLLHLDLSGTKAHAEGGVALGGMLKHNNHLRVLELRGAMLCELEDGGEHSDDAMKEIGDGLSFNATLETLVLEDNSIPSRGCHMLSEGLFRNGSLVTLDMSHNRVGMNVQAMNEIFHLILAENLTLKHFIIAGNPVGPGVLSAVRQWEQTQEQRRMERNAAARSGGGGAGAGWGGAPGIGNPGGGGAARIGPRNLSLGPSSATSSVGVFPVSLFPADASLGSFALPGLPSVAPGVGGAPLQPGAPPGFAAAMAMPGTAAPNRMARSESIAGVYTAPPLNPAAATAAAAGAGGAGMMPGGAPPHTASLQGVVPSTFARQPPPPGAPPR